MRWNISVLGMLAIFGTSVLAQDRLPPIPADKQTAAQKKAIVDYKALRKTDLTGPALDGFVARARPGDALARTAPAQSDCEQSAGCKAYGIRHPDRGARVDQ